MRIAILVEGITEETFVNELLVNHYLLQNKDITPIILTTKRVASGNKFKGGMPNYRKIRKEIKLLLGSFDKVTTMFDYYGLSSSFPGFKTQPIGDPYLKVNYLESQLANDINSVNFIPYIQLHEFEGLLFSADNGFKYVFPDKKVEIASIQKIMITCPNPELINLGKTTAPSKRILSIFPDYEKPFHGALMAISIGLSIISRKCSHFNNWINTL